MRRTESIRLTLPSEDWLQGQSSWTEAGGDGFVVLFLHGFGSVRWGEKPQALEAACARRAWPFATFDFRGHGESSGTLRALRGSRLLEDLEAIRQWADQRGWRRLFLVGSSMGAWVATWGAMLNPGVVPAVALIAPGLHFLTARYERMSPEDRAQWEREGVYLFTSHWVQAELEFGLVQERERFDHQRLLMHYVTPTLIFHGLRDDIVSWERSVAFMREAANAHLELRLYKDGDHRLVEDKEEMAEAACELFARYV
ncbi:MAG TPA: alpha/beta fold hydrolase [Gemmatales bacterium]|nr:alpha/beta fold hydrolase [Gemmatales bacterium]